MSSRIFTLNDYLLLDEDPQLEYRRRQRNEKKSIHWGQWKLLLTEIEFLTRFWNPQDVSTPKIVYAGAAPGKHIPFLSLLFPAMEFHLYDPRKFHIQETDKIHLYQQYFTDEDAHVWAGRNDVYFISDIRRYNYADISETENEKAIVEDMRMQENWYNIIKPVYAHLKFRLPYSSTGLGDVIPQDRFIQYLDGFVFKQAWAPQTSTETRLVPYGVGILKQWDSLKYEQQMFYHNTAVSIHI